MSDRIVLDDEFDLEKHEKRAEDNPSYGKVDYSEKLWESDDFPVLHIDLLKIFDAILNVSSIYHEKSQYEFEKFILTSGQVISYGGYDGTVFAGTGRLYLKGLWYPDSYIPEHMMSWFPCHRYLTVGFTMRDDEAQLSVVSFSFCEHGQVLSKFNLKTKRYRVELPWV